MRNKAAISKLGARAAIMRAPTEGDSNFQIFTRGLSDVLSENGIPGEWDFDAESGTFYAVWEQSIHAYPVGALRALKVDPAAYVYGALGSKRTATLDPRKPLADEVQRLITEHRAYVEWCAALENLVDTFNTQRIHALHAGA